MENDNMKNSLDELAPKIKKKLERTFCEAALNCVYAVIVATAVLPIQMVRADVLANWSFSGINSSGNNPSPGKLAPSATAANITVGNLSLGSGVTIPSSNAGNSFGGSVWGGVGNTSESTAVADGAFETFTFTASSGFAESFSSISAYNVRRSNTGPANGIWQYEIGGGSFVDIGSSIGWGSNTAAAGNAQSAITLSGISDLQNVPAGTTVTFRVANWPGSSGGTWYFNGGGTNPNLTINGTVTQSTVTPPSTAYFWIGSDTTLGGNGTWDASSTSSWSADSTTIAATTWDSTKTATFGGTTAGTVSVSGGVEALNGINFTTTGYQLADGGGGSVKLTGGSAGANTVSTDTGVTATISVPVDATASGFTKTGAGTLILADINSPSTTISGGTLQVGNGTSGGSFVASDLTSTASIAAGATLKYMRSDDITVNGAISGPGTIEQAGTGKITFTGALGSATAGVNLLIDGSTVELDGNMFGPITNNGALIYNHFSATGNVTQSDPITGTGSVEKQGIGTLTVTGNFSYTGGTTITGGTIQVGNGGTTGSLSGNVVNNGALSFNRSDATSLSGSISGSGSVSHIGAGSVTLSGNNSYAGGTTVSGGGALRGTSNTAFGGASSGPINLSNGSVLAGDATHTGLVIPNSITVSTPASGNGILADWTFETSQPASAGPFAAEAGVFASSSLASAFHSAGGTYNQVVGNGSAHAFNSAGWTANTDYYQFTTSTAGVSGITLKFDQTSSTTGPGKFQLAYSTDGTNFINFGDPYTVTDTGFSGGTNNPALTFTVDLSGITDLDNKPTVTFRLVDNSTTSASGGTVGTAGTDRVDNVIVQAANSGGTSSSSTIGSDVASGTVTYAGNISLSAPVSLTSAAGGTVSFTGTISDSGSAGVIKVGAGAVVLNHQESYSSPTVVQQGTLKLGVTNAITSSSSMILAGGTLSSSGLVQDFTTGASATLGVTSTSTLDLGGAGSIKFADSHIGNSSFWTGTLNVTGWKFGVDHLYFGSDKTALTTAQLAAIHFADFGPGTSITTTASGGDVTPLMGDINQDGTISAADVSAMTAALSNVAGYKTQFFGSAVDPTGDVKFLLDEDHNGIINNADLQAEISLVATAVSNPGGGSLTVVPEPSGFILIGLGGLLLLGRRKLASRT